MTNDAKLLTAERCSKMIEELRKETLEAQKLRAQFIGWKITFVSAGIGYILANMANDIKGYVLLLPAIAAIFFDFLIYSYSFSIKRIGYYVRTYLEPEISGTYEFRNEKFLMWEEFISSKSAKQSFSKIGNLGITFLAVITAVVGLVIYPETETFRWYEGLLIILLAVLLGIDYYTYEEPRRKFGNKTK